MKNALKRFETEPLGADWVSELLLKISRLLDAAISWALTLKAYEGACRVASL